MLNSILNPNLPLGEGIFDPEEVVPDRDEDKLQEDDKVKKIDSEAVKAAEAGDLDTALRLFDEAVSLAPARPASFNNRAQCLRLLGRPEAALRDLDTAVSLSQGGRGKAGAAALCQRGVLHRKVISDSDRYFDISFIHRKGETMML